MGDKYPLLLSNDGFAVTDEEAKIMARIARNYVTIQRTLPDENLGAGMESKPSFKRDDVMNLLVAAMHDNKPETWPRKRSA